MAGLKYNCDTSVFLDIWNGVILPSCDVWGKKQHAKLRNMQLEMFNSSKMVGVSLGGLKTFYTLVFFKKQS